MLNMYLHVYTCTCVCVCMCVCVNYLMYIIGYTEDLTTSIGLSKVSKQLGIASLPEILVLQIKRFFLGHRVSKYTAAISFPLILDMAPYCTNECLKVTFHLSYLTAHDFILRKSYLYIFISFSLTTT